MSSELINAVEWTFLAYFAAINAAYLAQCLLAVFSVRRYLKSSAIDELDPAYSTLHLPISLVVPAYNESKSIVTSVKALLQLEYPDFEVVVVNDGSTDDTLEKLVAGFQLYRYPEAYRKQVPCRPVIATYRSARYRNLRVVSKENGGSKADAANAGIIPYGPERRSNCLYHLFVDGVQAVGPVQADDGDRTVRFPQDRSSFPIT